MKHELLFCKDCEYAKYRPDIREGTDFWFCWKHKKYITESTVIISGGSECRDYRERKKK